MGSKFRLVRSLTLPPASHTPRNRKCPNLDRVSYYPAPKTQGTRVPLAPVLLPWLLVVRAHPAAIYSLRGPRKRTNIGKHDISATES